MKDELAARHRDLWQQHRFAAECLARAQAMHDDQLALEMFSLGCAICDEACAVFGQLMELYT